MRLRSLLAAGWTLALVLSSSLEARAADAPATFKVADLTFTRPSAWEWVPSTSSMRKAELKAVDSKSKAAADVVFFSGFGGGVKANVDRWFSQFKEPRSEIQGKTEEVTIGKYKITYAYAQGTYMSGMPGGPQTPKANHALLGAIIEGAQESIFIRMTGPADWVKASTGDFRKMIDSAVK